MGDNASGKFVTYTSAYLYLPTASCDGGSWVEAREEGNGRQSQRRGILEGFEWTAKATRKGIIAGIRPGLRGWEKRLVTPQCGLVTLNGVAADSDDLQAASNKLGQAIELSKLGCTDVALHASFNVLLTSDSSRQWATYHFFLINKICRDTENIQFSN